ncbi:hypothetical protein HDV57DRAFT_390796 [Trichoderma longibrachiatum]
MQADSRHRPSMWHPGTDESGGAMGSVKFDNTVLFDGGAAAKYCPMSYRAAEASGTCYTDAVDLDDSNFGSASVQPRYRLMLCTGAHDWALEHSPEASTVLLCLCLLAPEACVHRCTWSLGGRVSYVQTR